MMVLDELLARRLVVLSGKGGVGKSVVGTALALAAHARGKRVLLVEVEAPREAAQYLGVHTRVGSHVTEVMPGLSVVNLDPDAVMAEYITETVYIEALARRILDSVVYQRFYAAAPGLPELMVLGKIMTLVEAREGRGRRPRYDLVIVDAPATGHGLAFLKVPLKASIAIPVGPVGNNARKILALLRDAKRTALALVAIPEEMAVVEAIEFHEMAKVELEMQPVAMFLNAAHEPRLTPAQESEVMRLAAQGAEGRLAPGVDLKGALPAARRHVRRRKMTAFYRRLLERSLPTPLVVLPYLFSEELDLAALRVLAARMEAA